MEAIYYTTTAAGQLHLAELQSRIKDAKSEKIIVDCPRCNGEGGIVEFAHVSNGICFLCKGSKQTYSYRTPKQQNLNRLIKEQILELSKRLVVPQEIIIEFGTNPKHHTPMFHSFVRNFMATNGFLGDSYDFHDILYRINCLDHFMYE